MLTHLPGQQYGQYGQQGQQGQQAPRQQQQQPPAQATPTIAKRPADTPTGPAAASGAQPTVKKEGGAKVLSIGGETAKPKAKVLSIGGTAPKEEKKTEAPKKEPAAAAEAGAKATAIKAIEKTGTTTKAASSGKTSPSPSSGRSSPTAASKAAATRAADAVEKEQSADVDQDTLKEMYGKEHVNIIFIGHVDAGKSTLGGSILYTTGMVDERTMDKLRREAKEAGRETWYLSWALDLTAEERSKGKTVEVGRGFFETDKRRYSILDAPGHKTYVPHMQVPPPLPPFWVA